MPPDPTPTTQSVVNHGAGGICSTHGCYDGFQCPGCRDRLPAMCVNCRERPATKTWGDALAATHGWTQRWCEVCVLEKQVEHARERAAALPELERRLEEARRA